MSQLWTPDDIALARREWRVIIPPDAPHDPLEYRLWVLHRRCELLRTALACASLAAGVLGGAVIYLLAKG